MNAKVKPKIIWSEECVSISEEQVCFIDMLISLISNTFFFTWNILTHQLKTKHF